MQELVEGNSLAQMVEAGWQPDQKEVERIANDLLTTFSYLQDQKVHLSFIASVQYCHSVILSQELHVTLNAL